MQAHTDPGSWANIALNHECVGKAGSVGHFLNHALMLLGLWLCALCLHVCRWVVRGVGFDAVLKLFRAAASRYPVPTTAAYLDTLLEAGLPGQVSPVLAHTGPAAQGCCS